MTNIKEMFKTRAKGFVTDPKKLVRYVVLLICCVVVIFQLSECFTKLYRPPITTHSHFDLNETISYPAITFCRDPAYKEDVLKGYNLSYHPKFSNSWRNFDFKNVDLKVLFENATYGKSEFFGQYGLDGSPNNVEIVSGIYFNYGQCHTMKPLVTTRGSWKNHGYSLILKHTMEATDETKSLNIPGWHVFLHEIKENFTGPWMPGVDLPYCSNYTDMRDLLSSYQTLEDINISECGCANPCKSVIYSAYVMNRGQFDKQAVPSSQVWLYYTSKMITIFAERPNYDLTLFVADMGGSLGFLLGLSVLGLIKILEKIVSLVFGNYIRKHQEKVDKVKLDENKESDLSSTTTLELPHKLSRSNDKT